MHRLFERHLRGRRDLDRDRPKPLAVVDLVGPTAHRHIGDRPHRNDLAQRRRHRQRLNLLSAVGVLQPADDRQVDLVPLQEVVSRISAIDQRVGGVAQVGSGDPHFGGLDQPRPDVDFGSREVQARVRPGLGILAQHRADLAHDLPAETNEFLQFRTGDLDVDRPPGPQSPFEQAGLIDDGDGARQLRSGLLDDRSQFAGSGRFECPQPEKHSSTPCHKEEVSDDRSVQLRRLGTARIDIPVRCQFRLDRLAQLHHLVDVVAGRRHQDRKNQVAVARRQVLDPGPELVAEPHRNSNQQQHHRQAAEKPQLDPAIEPDDRIDEPGGQAARQSDQQRDRWWVRLVRR